MERMCRGGGRNIWPSSRFMMTRAANQASQGATERPAGELGSSRGTAVRSGSFLTLELLSPLWPPGIRMRALAPSTACAGR